MIKKVKSAIFGHAIGDALGVPVEFVSREILKKNPVVDMREYGTHNQPEGTWSDDTSMTLSALDSLSYGLDYDRIMKSFCKWEKNAEYTADGVVFDEGITTHFALSEYMKGKEALRCGGKDENNNGNGSLMRIIPFVLYCHYGMNTDISDKIEVIHNASSLTHAHIRSKMGCGIYAFVMFSMLENPDKSSVEKGLKKAYDFYSRTQPNEIFNYNNVFAWDFEKIAVEQVKSSGYVVDTLESALWCIMNSDSYSECVLKAVNLGRDTDTVGAVAGGLAGLLYGIENIPDKWLSVLRRKEYIESLCEKFALFL